jgi:hypothetical protein
MKQVCGRTLAGALAVALLTACGAAAPAGDAGLATVLEREARKADMLFGAAPERQAALRWYAADFLNVAPGTDGMPTERLTLRELEQVVPSWPALPPGSFRSGEQIVITITQGYVISALVTMPTAAGGETQGWSTSVWSREGDEWKTVLYQLTPR